MAYYREKHTYIVVMGATGTGKSTFIRNCSNQDVKASRELESCTAEIQEVVFMHNSSVVHLIDTPGFDDSSRYDADVLADVADWLAETYHKNMLLNGIVYLHSINGTRMSGTDNRNLTMFKNLCGENAYQGVVLATTGWPENGVGDHEYREHQLMTKPEYWGTMCQNGSQVLRLMNTRLSALSLVDYIQSLDKKTVLKIQEQMVDQKLALPQTAAGGALDAELAKQMKEFSASMARIEKRLEQAISDRDYGMRKVYLDRIAEMDAMMSKVNEDRRILRDNDRPVRLSERIGRRVGRTAERLFVRMGL
ncbi:putative GTP-binding HSR1-related [Rosellinia necatrix]|uniref:Putative GTP-binding HSR1-related n=1 Tax=Rosellinia necatrix TaxID=77044 RepID=A0A1W2TV22_ROSNE|nr:putative GTP-binding HSR1-related [Rosellinia necatrix]